MLPGSALPVSGILLPSHCQVDSKKSFSSILCFLDQFTSERVPIVSENPLPAPGLSSSPGTFLPVQNDTAKGSILRFRNITAMAMFGPCMDAMFFPEVMDKTLSPYLFHGHGKSTRLTSPNNCIKNNVRFISLIYPFSWEASKSCDDPLPAHPVRSRTSGLHRLHRHT